MLPLLPRHKYPLVNPDVRLDTKRLVAVPEVNANKLDVSPVTEVVPKIELPEVVEVIIPDPPQVSWPEAFDSGTLSM
jgi:hypothetical protein